MLNAANRTLGGFAVAISMRGGGFVSNEVGSISQHVSRSSSSGAAGHGGAVFMWAQQDLEAPPPSKGTALAPPPPSPAGALPSSPAGWPQFANWPSLAWACRLQMDAVTVESNTCDGGSGGGVLLLACAARVSSSTWRANRASISGGAWALIDSKVLAASALLQSTWLVRPETVLPRRRLNQAAGGA